MHEFEAIYLASRGRHVNGSSKRKDDARTARPSWHKREQKVSGVTQTKNFFSRTDLWGVGM